MAESLGEPAVATVLIAPLVADPSNAAGPALGIAAKYLQADPLFDTSTTEDEMRALASRAVERDPKLWRSRHFLITSAATRSGELTVVEPLRALVAEFPELTTPMQRLIEAYSELGWVNEADALTKELAARAPEDASAQAAAAGLHERDGDWERVDQLLGRVSLLEPDGAAFLTRALERRDYPSAIAELQRLQGRLKAGSPAAKGLDGEIRKVRILGGVEVDTLAALEARSKEELKNIESCSSRTSGLPKVQPRKGTTLPHE